MWRSRTPLLLVLAAVSLAPARAQAAPADDFRAVAAAFARSGTVDGCAFSATVLASARRGVPTDVETYDPELPEALDAALRKRAGGDCERPAAGGSTTPDGDATAAGAAPGATIPADPAAPATTPAPAPEATASPAASDGSVAAAARRDAVATRTDDLPLPLVLLAILLVLALLLALVWALLRFFAVDPPWVERQRHATAEAGWRASASWAEFTDWVRMGR